MDYQLLEKMNLRAAEKYHSMADHADSLVIARDKMVTKCECCPSRRIAVTVRADLQTRTLGRIWRKLTS